MCGVLSDSSLFYRYSQVIALLNSCQNKFGLFDQFTWRKKSEGSAQSEEVYFNEMMDNPQCLARCDSEAMEIILHLF